MIPTDRTARARAQANPPTVLICDECEVTWRDRPGAPCWFCDRPGQVVSPERLVLD